MKTELPRRKPHRLLTHDYSAPGAYFITFCTQNRRNLLWETGTIAQLSPVGEIVRRTIEKIPDVYPVVQIDTYTVMPNHVHLLLQIHADENGMTQPAPSISRIVQQLKGHITRETGENVWQKLFHDHIIRTEADYLAIYQYIAHNPAQWQEDCFYMPD